MARKAPISAGFCLVIAFMILIVPFRWLVSIFLAAIVHECCHYIAIRLLTGRKTDVRFYSYSARMDLPDMGRGKELLCAVAGPIGGIALIFFAPLFPRLAVCALVQSLYNLLPIYPLDGGRALSCVLAILYPPPLSEKIQRLVTGICKIVLAIMCLYGWYHFHLGPLCLLLGILMLVRIK